MPQKPMIFFFYFSCVTKQVSLLILISYRFAFAMETILYFQSTRPNENEWRLSVLSVAYLQLHMNTAG